MKRTSVSLRRPVCCAAFLVFAVTGAQVRAQTTAPGSTEPPPATSTVAAAAAEEEEIIELSPFLVEASEDADRYLAKSTLAGSRVRTDLKDIASSISVVTSEFLRDVGATNNQTLLQYTTNSEVGGVYGNYAGVGSTYIDGANEGTGLIRPNNNTRIRGLDSADNTRDYLLTDIPWDSYIVGRVDLQRGPNSILFGYGSPAGIINSSLNRATFKNGGNVENRLGSFGTVRFSLDYNQVLVEDELAIRVAALDDNTKYRQDPAYNHDKRLYLSMRWDPKLFGDSSRTSLRANYEAGDVTANRPRQLPPWDRITPFFLTSSPGDNPTRRSPGINRQVWDPYYAWEYSVIGYPRSPEGPYKNFWVVQYPGPGVQATANPMFYYSRQDQLSPSMVIQAAPTTYWGLGVSEVANGEEGTSFVQSVDSGINGFPYGSNIGIGSFNEYAYNHWRTYGDVAFPAADKGFYKQIALMDTSIFDYFNNSLDGPNKQETQGWNAMNVALEQTLFNNRLGLEVVYDSQRYQDSEYRMLGSPFISVDIRENLMVYPWAFDGGTLEGVEPGTLPNLVAPNPNAGRAFTGSGRGGTNNANFTNRENIRATLFADVRAEDFISDNKLASILGRHVFTGLYAHETYEVESRNWVGYAADMSWADAIGSGDAGPSTYTTALGSGTYNGGSGAGGIVNGDLNLDVITYLTDDLRGLTSASGLNIGRITAVQSPHGMYNIPYYNSRWNAPTVDPSADWYNPARRTEGASTQSENLRNYVGWQSADFDVRNARQGDIDQLYSTVSKVQTKMESMAITWQAFLFDETVVATAGYREDEQKQRSGSSVASDPNGPGYALVDPPLAELDPETGVAKDSSLSWGVVVHTPKAWREKLPYRSNISLTYSDGENARVQNRYGFDGAALPNQKGTTTDIGIVLSTLDDRLRVKVTYYDTKVSDANLSSVSSEVTTLGNNTYYLRNLEAWGTASAMLDLAGRDGGASGWEWYWNWALIAQGWDWAYADPTGAAFRNHPETIQQTAIIDSWLAQMQPQAWYDAYGFPVHVDRAKAKDWRTAIDGWTPYSGVGGVQPSGGGRINGSWPTGTVDNESKGTEVEIIGQPLRNWNLSVNFSKVHAAQTALGVNLVNFIEAQHTKFLSPAGDLRLWWGGDATVRQYYDNNIWSAYQFQAQTNGKMVPEMAPWRANLVTNYNFDTGMLKGANIGVGYRWQDGRILGYALNADNSNLDVNNAYWSNSEDWIDMWMGYQRKLSEKLTWRIQLNLRSLFRNPELVPLSVQPDGSPAAFKIEEGFTWQLTNTISF